MTIEPTPFGTLPDGRAASLYALDNGRGLRASVTDYGATLVDLQTPDREGEWGSVTLGYPDLAGYLDGKWYLGAVCGRFANRISGSWFTIDGRTHVVSANEGENHLHGGTNGFDKALWTVRSALPTRIVLELMSPDGEEGYPGNLRVRVSYTLTTQNALRLDYWAVTDKATPVNLTHHAYFNLAARGDVLGQHLRIHASRFLPTGKGSIPTGELAEVAGTPFDFRKRTALEGRVLDNSSQIQAVGGVDHCFVIDSHGLAFAALVEDPVSGRTMSVFTDQPGLQVYTGNYLDGKLFPKHGGLCLETQHFPNSPHHARFPDTVLRPGNTLRSTTEYRFGIGATR